VNVSGGTVSGIMGGIQASGGSVVNLSNGLIGFRSSAEEGSTVNIIGATVGEEFSAGNDGEVNIIDGEVGPNFDALNASAVNIAGGTVGTSFDALSGSVINVSGGVIGNDFDADSGSTVNIYATQLVFDGEDSTDEWAAIFMENPFEISDRDVTFSGLLADGSPFDFRLNSTNLANTDYFHPNAHLILTLVSTTPGDFNDDGIVNAADYTVWRNALGTDVAIRGKFGDGNFDGQVTQADYFVWKKYFGESGDGSGASFEERFPFAVPEPVGILQLFIAATIGICSQRRRLYSSRSAR
jgi:hypothetical protein